jgi:pimeloyl-ACP methyl ester carboxylesterase
VIAFCHEFAGNRWGAVPYVQDLRRRGFDVFAFDFRNHGASERVDSYRPMPWLTQYELADVQAAINYLCFRDDADPRGIGIMGISKGGTAALCAAADDPRVRAIITDGAFPLGAMQRFYLRRFMKIYTRIAWLIDRLPDVCLVSYFEWAKLLLGLRRHCRFVNVEQMTRRVRQPVFMIHGQQDAYVPLEVVRALRGCLAGRSKLWVVPDAKHNQAIAVATREYHRRIARFFQRTLAGRELGLPVRSRPPWIYQRFGEHLTSAAYRSEVLADTHATE